MWYVVQVSTGSEELTRLQCEARIPAPVLERCFIPHYEEKVRIQGTWTLQQKRLFPGYLFVITEQPEELYESLKNVQSLTKLLNTGGEIIPLTAEEVEFLESFGGEAQIVPMSTGVIEDQKVMVTDGPLKGKEGIIKRIDRHKRKAYLETELFGRMVKMQVGLEIVAKT